MDTLNHNKKIKKYLLYISVVFFLLLFIHLCFQYLYADAKKTPLSGGILSEGLIGDIPHLNPLIPSDKNNRYTLSLLYRSLLSYNPETKSIESDIASCNLEELGYIECNIDAKAKWSDGTPIEWKDVLKTYQILKNQEYDIHPQMIASLKDTEIENRDGVITFTNPNKDINFLHVLFQPIVPAQVLDSKDMEQLKSPFSITDNVYSGPFFVQNIEIDETLWIKKLSLHKNTHYKNNEMYIDRYSLKFFSSQNTLLKNKSRINIFHDDNNIIGTSVPRLERFSYTLPQFTAAFINTERVQGSALRWSLLAIIDREKIIKNLGQNYISVSHPYIFHTSDTKNPLEESTIDSSKNNIKNELAKLGYYKKEHFVEKVAGLKNTDAEKYSQEIQIELPQETKIITSGTNTTINFVSEDDILLQWKPTDDTTAVYINDYRLTGYSAGNDVFHYRLKESYDSIIEGENRYKIYFEQNGKKVLQEELTFFYYKDPEVLGEKETAYQARLEEKSQQEQNNKLLAKRQEDITFLKNLEELKGDYYYNEELAPYTLTLMYLNDNIIEKTADYIRQSFQKNGIKIDFKPISVAELSREEILKQKADYDIIISGIDLWYFDFNIYPYFFSGEAVGGYNLSRVKKPSLDLLLGELKSDNLNKSKRTELQKNVLEVLENAQVVKTLYSPIWYNLVDKNIKNYSLPAYLPDEIHRFAPLEKAYILEKKIVHFKDKTLKWFIGFLFSGIFSHDTQG